jgi:ABC-type branched-subunit amino acid transport system substrate-binding protein
VIRVFRLAPLAIITALALLSTNYAGCTARTSGDNGGQTTLRLYGSDGNMSSSFGDALRDRVGILTGMKGTTPLTRLTDDFKHRMSQIDPALLDYNYGGEAYDAVAVAALAAEAAHSTDSASIARFIVPVTAGSNTCTSLKVCMELIRAGKDIAYRGVSLTRSGFTPSGEPSTASYGVLNFGRDNHIDEGRTEYVGAGDEATAGTGSVPARGGGQPPPPLKIGGLLPHTGQLGFIGRPLFAGAQLAVAELNDHDGVLGSPVEWIDGDDGTSATVANATLDRHIAAGVQVIIGAAASSVTAAVLPRAVAAGRVLISPASTSDALSTIPDNGLFFRTSPPDTLQGRAIADIVMRDGNRRLAIVARDDSYGNGLRTAVQKDLVDAGLKRSDIAVFDYPPQGTYEAADERSTFQPLGERVKQFKPDAALIVGYDESALVIKGLAGAGMKLGT